MVKTNGTGLTNLYSFTGGSDGAYPQGLVLSDNHTLYGFTSGGGTYGSTSDSGGSATGTVFAVNTDGTGFTTLHWFAATPSSTNDDRLVTYTNSNGGGPSGLVLSGNMLYGTAAVGGSSGNGTVFRMGTDGTGFRVLHTFTAPFPSFTNDSGRTYNTNNDGANPSGWLVLSGSTLYGTAENGGSSGSGTVFAINTDGTEFATLYSFSEAVLGSFSGFSWKNDDGAGPNSLLLSGQTLYGTASYGGNWRSGTVFSLSFTPQLTAFSSQTHLILSWPTNYAGFDYTGYGLESTTDVVSPVWITNPLAPAVINGRKMVTVPVNATQQFFRLRQ
jgi:uncharacterized repeat protein (TIGR03803 family)